MLADKDLAAGFYVVADERFILRIYGCGVCVLFARA